MPIFRVKSVKIYTGPKKIYTGIPVAPVTNMRYGLDGNGGFGHHRLIIVPKMVSDCRDGFDRLVENCAERSDHQ